MNNSTIETPSFLCHRTIKNDWRMQKETVTFDKLTRSGRLSDRTSHRVEKEWYRNFNRPHQTNTCWLKLRMLAVLSEKPSLPFIHWYAKGCFLPNKKGKKLYFYEDELLAWIENGRRKTSEQTYEEMLANMQGGIRHKPKSSVKL